MSETKQAIPAHLATRRVNEVIEDLRDLCVQIEPAGSLRRGRDMVNDVEIVALPKRRTDLLARLDRWVLLGEISKAFYGGAAGKQSNRWGDKYRGFEYRGVRIEIFLADADNWGYIYWLRTGTGQANQFVMQQLLARKAPYGPLEGYWYWYPGRRKISVPDELELFRLLGIMHVIPPGARREEAYRTLMTGNWATTVTWAGAEDEMKPVQGRLL
ncbi:MAG: hypothetical protein L6Q98_23550 [Anaerolineae bacterium]|nr:hypothetical protein [Anaerolineae bacterium]NUQ06370.1 hypothetical protein [Anaerolineae bacterium]